MSRAVDLPEQLTDDPEVGTNVRALRMDIDHGNDAALRVDARDLVALIRVFDGLSGNSPITHDRRRPEDLPQNVPEPKCGDLVQFRHLEPPGLFKVCVTNRYHDRENLYGFREVNGGRTFNLSEDELTSLWETDKSARWPKLYAEVDLMKRRRDTATGGITYHGEIQDAAEIRRRREEEDDDD